MPMFGHVLLQIVLVAFHYQVVLQYFESEALRQHTQIGNLISYQKDLFILISQMCEAIYPLIPDRLFIFEGQKFPRLDNGHS